MNINPAKILQLRNAWSQFTGRHPKLPMFFQAVSSRALEEGTVIEVTVTRPDGEQMASNVRLTAEDIALFRELNVF